LNTETDVSIFEYWFLDLNRLILNFLSAVRTYLDHTETRLKREKSKYPEEIKFFEVITSYAYDNNFSYRFLYNLRNYAQHCGLPSGNISIKSYENTTGEVINSLTILLVRDQLLEKFDGWKAVRKEIAIRDEHFDIIPLIDSMLMELEGINTKIYDRILSSHNQEGHILLNLLMETRDIKGAPGLIKVTGSNNDVVSVETIWFPCEIISRITGVVFE
jgi:hypothetical protein